MVDKVSYSSTLVRNAFAVITDIFSAATVNIAFGFTDLKEVLFIGGLLILVFLYIIIQGIEAQQSHYKGNQVLIVTNRVFSKAYLFFYFITIRFFVSIVNDQIVLFDITWHSVLAISVFILSWLFILLKD